jgi:hypothetical protein
VRQLTDAISGLEELRLDMVSRIEAAEAVAKDLNSTRDTGVKLNPNPKLSPKP